MEPLLLKLRRPKGGDIDENGSYGSIYFALGWRFKLGSFGIIQI